MLRPEPGLPRRYRLPRGPARPRGRPPAERQRQLAKNQKQKPPSTLPDLIERKIREVGSQAKLAEVARVSTKTINLIKAGKYTAPQPDDNAPDRWRPVRGFVEAITRLAVHLGADPHKILAEYGVELGEPAISTAIDRALREAASPRLLRDCVLDAIQLRGQGAPAAADIPERGEGIIRVGILAWPPFHDGTDDSFGVRYMDTLIGITDPRWRWERKKKHATVQSINSGIESLLQHPSQDDSDKNRRCDLVFGIFDTPYRRIIELDFLSVPGIRVPLGALVSDGSLSWSWILGFEDKDRPKALVLKYEAGHLYMEGACRYVPKEDLIFVDESKATSETIFDESARQLRDLVREQKGKREVIFVADEQTTRKVRHRFTRQYGGGYVQLGTKEGELASPPRYDLGLAFRADAVHFKRLLENAHVNGLWAQCLPQMAQLYADLFFGTPSDEEPTEPQLLEWDWAHWAKHSGRPRESGKDFNCKVMDFMHRIAAKRLAHPPAEKELKSRLPRDFLTLT